MYATFLSLGRLDSCEMPFLVVIESVKIGDKMLDCIVQSLATAVAHGKRLS